MATRLSLLAALAVFLAPLALAQDPLDDEDDAPPSAGPPSAATFDFEVMAVDGALMQLRSSPSQQLGATPGGMQDISTFRALAARGVVPAASALTPEGLFSEHDLPLRGGRCDRMMCLDVGAAPADLLVQDDVQWLAQIGFTSGLDVEAARPPLNLVLVVDQSGSMDGDKIEATRRALREIVGQLGPDDRVAIVGFASGVSVLLSRHAAQDAAVLGAIDGLTAGGSTNIEGGLERGFELARAGKRGFDGVTRVVVLTDEQPNVGAVHPGRFMELARAASDEGIGLTTVGVGMDLGHELAAAVSSVRGGNCVSIPSVEDVVPRLREDFALLAVELAYDLRIEVTPADGLSIAGVYGVPGPGVEWMEGGGIALSVETVFASRERGGLYVGLQGDPGRGPVANAHVRWTARDGLPGAHDAPVDVLSHRPVGLVRGPALVDLATGVASAIARYDEGDSRGAVSLLAALDERLRAARDAELDGERELLADLRAAMGLPAGVASRDPITGLPPR